LAALERPISLYYPGSSSDGSFTRLPDVRAIHVDSALDDTAIRDFEVLGAEAYRADAYTWSPAEPIDVVTLINPSGIDEDRVLGMSRLRDDGIVLWASWSGVPSRLVERKDMRLIGVISDPGEGDLTVDTENLGDYFTRKAFTALDDSEQAFFMRRLQQYLDQYGLDLTVPAERLYTSTCVPRMAGNSQGTWIISRHIQKPVHSLSSGKSRQKRHSALEPRRRWMRWR